MTRTGRAQLVRFGPANVRKSVIPSERKERG
jgi:hypothetical protein